MAQHVLSFTPESGFKKALSALNLPNFCLLGAKAHLVNL